MKKKRKWPVYALIIILLCAGIVYILPNYLNRYQKDGNLRLKGLHEQVTVYRDEKGMAYIYARNLDDALMAQGFVTAQDRLFQMELTRLFSSGRISELAGEKGKDIDIRMRTIGFARNARKHAKLLSPETRRFFQKYADGVNAYIRDFRDTHHIKFKLAGIKPSPWTIEDSLTIMYFMGWNSAGNIRAEIVSQMLVDKLGLKKAKEIFPITTNPDERPVTKTGVRTMQTCTCSLQLARDKSIRSLLEPGPLSVGSNNWAVGPGLSPSGKPIVANDPHLDSRILPGPWYPCGLILPKLRSIGVIIPGIPGMVVGRTNHFAIGVTNAYGDAQDLFIETLDPEDPGKYMEGEKSFPFRVIEETLHIKDKTAPEGLKKEKISIRFSRRGPVVSGILPDLKTKKVMTLRWSPFETMGPHIGLEKLLSAASVEDVRKALRHVNVIMLNFVFADMDGNIGWHVSSSLPIRSQADGALPQMIRDGRDHWKGWVPWDEMPQSHNPKKGWVGTCNHLTVGSDYPYYFSSRVSSCYRYQRLKQLMNTPGTKSAEAQWRFQQDTLNLMAQKIAPIMVNALKGHEDTKEMARILSEWDYRDDPDKAAPAIFQSVYNRFAWLVFKDELGEGLTQSMLAQWTYWQERLQGMVLGGVSPWFDDTETENIKETRESLFYQASLEVLKELQPRLGDDLSKWKWGKLHQIEFVSPVRRTGFGKGLLGGGSHPFPGSSETLCRGYYDFNKPYNVIISASLRMVADLGDKDKVMAVLPGGVSGRIFDTHTKDQIEAFVKGRTMYWWFSDKAITEHATSTLALTP